jgi:uncharacterized membrane protein YqiK
MFKKEQVMFDSGLGIVATLAVPFVFFGALILLFTSTWIIAENQSGLVIKKFGKGLAQGQLIALNGEAGYQADLLSPGWHFALWSWKYEVRKVPLIRVEPGEIALIVAADGETLPSERILGHEVDSQDFQSARAFLENGGEKGRQLAFLTSGSYRINPALFQVVTTKNAEQFGVRARDLRVYEVESDMVGIVTVLDGKPIPNGDLAGLPVEGHDHFQRGQAFITAGGYRGLQEQVLLSGSWNLNPWFVKVDQIPMSEIPIGYVGVVVSYVGKEHLDVSGDDFTHGDLVERGRKGVWNEPLLPGKHPLNTCIMKVELVPTTNIVLNWATRSEMHKYDEKLKPVTVRSKDGFSFTLDVSQIIHIGMKQAPRVISRVGSMQNLVDHVLEPTVANYFRNSAQQVGVLDFLSARTDRQREAFDAIRGALSAYDVECIDTLIGDILPPAELMKTQTDRKIAEEMQRTYDVQREAQVKRQELERETSIANMQSEVVRSEQMVRISERNALAMAESAKGDAVRVRLAAEAEGDALRHRADAEGHSIRLKGNAEAEAVRAVGDAKASAYREGVAAMGMDAFTSVQLATVFGENQVKLVPEILVSGNNNEGSLANVLMAKMLKQPVAPLVTPVNGVPVASAVKHT